MSKAWAQAQLDAGGFVGLEVAVDEKSTETMIARSYGAPVLGDRVVIRLTSERLMPAEDLSMEFLGLEGKSVSEPMAKQHRTALEFGHWALIHQPKHARYALDLVKRMKAAARKAVSKAGHAWDLYVEMAEELGQSVRHFLPTFWEQAARAYKELGNTTYAGRAITKALEAERVHSLEVDREHRRDAILEFTLSGCLSGKALTDYARDLEKQFPPLEAYETFKDLIVRRTLGGMPPIANCASDLARMAKAAGLKADEQIEEVLEAIMTSPAMSRAPFQFWKSVKKQVGNVVTRSPSFAMRLLVHTNPTTSYSSDSPVWEWIDLLDEWQVLPYLSMPASKLPQDVEIPGGRAGWFSRVACVEVSPNKRVFELLEQMADAIRAEKQPLSLSIGYHKVFDVDVLEMALDLGIDVAIPEQLGDLNFDGWLRELVDHPRRNSQLKHVCGHPAFLAKLFEQIPELVKFQGDRSKEKYGRTLAPRRSFEEAAAGHASVEQAWWEFIDKQLKALETGALADFEMGEENLSSSCRPKTGEQFPQLIERLSKIDVGACFQRTLVAGVIDEYGWAELDRVAQTHPVPTTERYGEKRLYSAFPYMSWIDKDTLHFVTPTSSSSCEILLKRTQHMLFAVPVGSQYAIIFYDSDGGWKAHLRWSSEPTQDHEQTSGHYVYGNNWEAVMPQGKDGIFAGERLFREGDTVVPTAKMNWYHDGQRFWRITGIDQYDRGKMRLSNTVSEIDPETGKAIRESIPPFFEESLPPGAEILWRQSHLLMKPNQPGPSPLGEKNGLIGLRCVKRRDGAIESVGVDGRSWVFTQEEQPADDILAAVAIIEKPTADSYWIATNDGRMIDSVTRKAFALYERRGKYFAGSPCELPFRYMHLLRVRCEQTSKALRAISRADADKLLAAGEVQREARRQKVEAGTEDPKRSEASRVAAEMFPQAPPRLIQGIARIAQAAADEHAAVQSILARLKPQDSDSNKTPAIDEQLVAEGFKELQLDQPASFSTHYSDSILGQHLPAIARYFSGHDVELQNKTRQFWFPLLVELPSVVYRTFWKRAIRDDEPDSLKKRLDSGWIHALRSLAHSGLLDLPGSFVLYSGIDEQQTAKLAELREKLENKRDVAFAEGNYRYVAYSFFGYPDNYIYLLGYSPKGECKPPKHFVVDEVQKIEITWKQKHIINFINALSKLDALPLPSAEKLEAAAARLGLHPISVAILWFGNLRTTLYARGQEKLSKEVREHYGWKVKDIQIAIAELGSVKIPDGLYINCLKDPSYILTKAGHNFDAMVNELAESRRAIAPFPAEISKTLDRVFPGYHKLPLKEFNELIMAPQEAELLKSREVDFKLPTTARTYSTLEVEIRPQPAFDPVHTYPKLAKAFALLNYCLPVGHEVRKQLPQAIEAVREFLDHADTLLPVGNSYLSYDASKSDLDTVIRNLISMMGKFEKDANGIYRCQTDTFFAGTIPPQIHCYFRPAKLKNDKDLQALIGVLQAVWPVHVYGNSHGTPAFVLSMRSNSMTDLIANNRSPNTPEGMWEQYPLHSVPEIVAECQKKLKVDETAAALYLQLLALPDPTSSNIKQWNGWSTKEISSIGAQLLEKELVVEAKRERAGRDLFLPGGWEPLKAPNLPLETWKLPLYGYENTDRLRGGAAETIIYEGTIPSLFEKAWSRWVGGDKPAYSDAPAKPGKSKPKK